MTSAQPAHQKAWRSRRAWTVLLCVTVLLTAADLISKSLAFAHIADQPVEVTRSSVLGTPVGDLQTLIPVHEPVVVVPHVLELKLVLNAGAVFGTGQGKRVIFIIFTVLALAFAVVMFALWTSPRDHLSHAAIALVIAGGLGNLYDRVRFACVRDFLHPLPTAHLPFGIKWPSGDSALWPYVSNVADAILLIGIAVLVVRLWRAPPPASSAAGRDDSQDSGSGTSESKPT